MHARDGLVERPLGLLRANLDFFFGEKLAKIVRCRLKHPPPPTSFTL